MRFHPDKNSDKEEAAEKFEDDFEWEEPLANCPSHRMLAMRRGEKEDFLILDIIIDEIRDSALSERGARMDDKRSEGAMEERKKVGYF